MDKKTLVVNLFGGPGSGKSTCAAFIFAYLKWYGIEAELVTEYAKEKIWEESFKTLEHQHYISAKQMYRMKILLGKVDVIVTDSPILLGILYTDCSKDDILKELILDEHMKMDTYNILMKRDMNKFSQLGRIQNLEQSVELDKKIKKILSDYELKYEEKINSPETGETIAKVVVELLKK